MRITISDMSGMKPVVLDGITAVVLAAVDASHEGPAASIAQGQPEQIAELAAIVLASVRDKLGQRAFDTVVRAASAAPRYREDITSQVRKP